MEQPYVYETIHEVPEPWRKLFGGRLNVRQVNAIMAKAYELGSYSCDNQGNPAGFVPAYATARKWFTDRHVVINGFWATRGEG